MKYILVIFLIISGCSKSPTEPTEPTNSNYKEGKFAINKSTTVVVPVDSIVFVKLDSVVIKPADTGLVIQRPCSHCHEIQNGVILDERIY